MNGKVQTVIVVKGGLVCSVYSTYPKNVHEVELLDMDNAKAESPEASDEMEARIDEVSSSPQYHEIF